MVVDEGGEPAGLVAPFKDGGAEMDVVDVQRRPVAEVEIGALAGAFLARPPGELVMAVMHDGKAAEHDVAELVAAQVPHRVHHPSHADRGPDFLRVVDA